ncbi:hypothetical protein [Methanolobus vulcani]|nr:hypothetical protein [Methanolobus vulcani]
MSETLSTISDKEYNELLAGDGHLVYETKSNHKKEINDNKEIDVSIYRNIADRIGSCETRDEAYQIIENEAMLKTKKDLLALTQASEIHTNKNDSREQIKEKIVESLVGFKIRSDSIKNIDLK